MAKFWSVLYCSHALRSISVPAELDERTRKTLFMYLGRKESGGCMPRRRYFLTLDIMQELLRSEREKYPSVLAKQGSDLPESVSTSTMRLNLVGAFGDPERDSVITHLR